MNIASFVSHFTPKLANLWHYARAPYQADADLFGQELVNLIDMRHELVALAAKIDWTALDNRFGGLYAAGLGRPGHPIRLIVGLQLLKYLRDCSDEQIVATWVENPY